MKTKHFKAKIKTHLLRNELLKQAARVGNNVDAKKKKKNKKYRTFLTRYKRRPCIFFCRLGQCDRGKLCEFAHDRRMVVVCPEYLQKGICSKGRLCLFSHVYDPGRVPVCVHYQSGACRRADCRYRHVKVSPSDKICTRFLKGFCHKGIACKRIHSYIPLEKLLYRKSEDSSNRSNDASVLQQEPEAIKDLQKIEDIESESEESSREDAGFLSVNDSNSDSGFDEEILCSSDSDGCSDEHNYYHEINDDGSGNMVFETTKGDEEERIASETALPLGRTPSMIGEFRKDPLTFLVPKYLIERSN